MNILIRQQLRIHSLDWFLEIPTIIIVNVLKLREGHPWRGPPWRERVSASLAGKRRVNTNVSKNKKKCLRTKVEFTKVHEVLDLRNKPQNMIFSFLLEQEWRFRLRRVNMIYRWTLIVYTHVQPAPVVYSLRGFYLVLFYFFSQIIDRNRSSFREAVVNANVTCVSTLLHISPHLPPFWPRRTNILSAQARNIKNSCTTFFFFFLKLHTCVCVWRNDDLCVAQLYNVKKKSFG